MLDDLNEQATAFIAAEPRQRPGADPKRVAMRRAVPSADRRCHCVVAVMLASAVSVPRRRAIGIHARRSHALRCVRPAAEDRSRSTRRHHPCRASRRATSRCRRKRCWTGSGRRRRPSRPITADFPSARCGCCWCRSRARACAAARPGAIAAPPSAFRLAATPPRDDLRRDWVMVHEMVHTRPARHGRPLCLAVGRACRLCRADRAGAGRRPHGAGDLAGDDARHAEGPAAGRRPRPRQYRHLGPQILGRRDVLPARRYRNPQSAPTIGSACRTPCAA